MSEQTDETESDDRATEETSQSGEEPNNGASEPKPAEDAGPMGNPAQDEEALRKEQEDESSGG